MKHVKYSILALILAAFPACSSKTPSEPTLTRTLERSETGTLTQKETQLIQAEAIVEKINHDTRQVQLKRADGSSVVITAGPEVKRLGEIKKGDKVVVKYFESLAYEVRQPTRAELASLPAAGVVVRKQAGNLPPGAGIASVTETIVTVKAIDIANGTAGIILPDGKNVTIKARYPENLERIKPGDKIAVTYSEAMAIAVDPV